MTTKITSDNIQPGSIQAASLAAGAAGGPKISSVTVTDSSYNNLDDTAVGLDGGYIKLSGTGFVAGCQVLINNTPVTSVSFVSSTEVRCQVPATAAGTYTLYLVNADGGVAIRVNGITFSATPTWVTDSTLPEAATDDSISIQLSATGATSYQLQAGSTLPTGLTLTSAGLLSGSVSVENETTYNFTIEAIDAENQESARAFSINITFGDEYFYATTLLLNGDGTNGANNNTFLDSSTNNFTITRNGNTTQGTFSPFSQDDGKWGVNTGSSSSNGISFADNAALQMGTGDFTIEGWFRPTATGSIRCFYTKGVNTTGGLIVGCSQSQIFCRHTGATDLTYSVTMPQGWNHIAWVRSGSTLSIYLNGVSVASATVSFNQNDSSTVYIGAPSTLASDANKYYGEVSNFRIVKGTALYTTTFTPSTSPLTNISGTSLLVFQSNRFKDNSSNAFSPTVFGTPSIQPFSPFAPSAAYSAATNGGSGYFDGSGDYLTLSSSPPTSLRAWASNDYTFECWFYTSTLTGLSYADGAGTHPTLIGNRTTNTTGDYWGFGPCTDGVIRLYYYNGSTGNTASSGLSIALNQWNHIAFTKTSSGIQFFCNGVGSSFVAINGTPVTGSDLPFLLGIANNTAISGYVAGARIVNGTAVYSGSTYTVPTAPLTAITNTSLLLNFTNAGILDNTGRNNLETVGNAQISTSVKKFGTGSILLTPGNSSYYTRMPLTEQLKFGTGDFTIECWIYLITNAAGICAIWSNYSSFGAGSLSLFAGHSSASTNHFNIAHNGGFPALASTTTVNSVLNTWTHLAVVRYNSQIKLYVNGVSEGTPFSSTAALNGVGSYFWVGTTGDSTAGNPNCYIDDFRITKGVARYTSNFTPPSSAHKLK